MLTVLTLYNVLTFSHKTTRSFYYLVFRIRRTASFLVVPHGNEVVLHIQEKMRFNCIDDSGTD